MVVMDNAEQVTHVQVEAENAEQVMIAQDKEAEVRDNAERVTLVPVEAANVVQAIHAQGVSVL